LNSASACPVCGSSDFRKTRKGIVAPFLARRIWGKEAFQIALVCCGACDFVFFNPRLEPSEEELLYRDYRGPEYLKARRAVEPWYTERFNAGFMDPDLLQARKAALAEIAECRQHEFDVIICSNVLEHVGSPRAIIDLIRSIAVPKTLVWVEVPQESPFGRKLVLRRAAQVAILLALRPKIGLGLLGSGMLHWMHEHVNFFNAESLQALLRSGGLDVLACNTYRLRAPEAGMVWAMGKVAGSDRR
jgi:hypothetical protein